MTQDATNKALAIASEQAEMPEVYEAEDDDSLKNSLALDIVNSAIPFFAERLEASPIPEEEKETVLSYYTGPSRKLKECVGEIIECIGAALLWHPPYKGMPDSKGNSDMMPGYYFIGLLAVDEHGEPQMYRTGAGGVLIHMAYKLRKDGWFIWPESVKYKVKQAANNAISLQRVDGPRPSILKGKGKK